MEDPRRERWERAADWPLTVVALLFLAAYAWPILDPDLGSPWVGIFHALTWAAWAVFALDYAVRLWLSNNRGGFVRTNHLAVVVLPVLRSLRLLRLVKLLSVLNRQAGGSLRGRVVAYVVGSTGLILFVAALAILDAERGKEGSNIETFGEAFWWAVATVTTVGYGDHFPVTTAGRFVAGGLMLAGIALLGVVTATFASWLIERVQEVEETSQAATRRDLEELTAEVAALREMLSTTARKD